VGREVLGWLAEGGASKEIVAQLGLRPKTVKHHRARIRDKFSATNTAAVGAAIAEGLVATREGSSGGDRRAMAHRLGTRI
jgi:DNA-binding CsgD family transcriptional regulator